MKKIHSRAESGETLHGLRKRLHSIIFESDTTAGKWFDVVLLWAIVLSVLSVMLESVKSIDAQYGQWLRVTEWFFTFLFTLEYLTRLFSVDRPLRYAFSFFGIVDFLAVLPGYLGLYFTQTQYLLVIRTIRLLRVFRIFKLARYLNEAEVLLAALKASRAKVTVFLGSVVTLVVIMGTIMYLIEGAASGFTSIPMSIYWAIVTLTTVGYGDIAPQTAIGQAVASLVMILGYAIIAVPTGIVTVELAAASRKRSALYCPGCDAEIHDDDARHCKHCGARLKAVSSSK
ncbi:MAG: ion transporter [Bacteroidetes bacterium]|nr:ion transporter [Bacteroidota bacterium]